MISRTVLNVVAGVLSPAIWAAYIWTIDRTLNIGLGVGPVLLVFIAIFILAMLAFPVILFLSVSKCSSMLTLAIIWGLTISIYSIMPIHSAVEVHQRNVRVALSGDLHISLN